jgi:hypothetical protein
MRSAVLAIRAPREWFWLTFSAGALKRNCLQNGCFNEIGDQVWLTKTGNHLAAAGHDKRGHPETLVAAQPSNLNAVRHGAHSPGAPRERVRLFRATWVHLLVKQSHG